MILELLNHPEFKDKISGVYLLFPTIEHMATTDNGKFLIRYVKPIVWLLVFLSWIFTLLPKIIQTLLLYIYLLLNGIPLSEQCENLRNLIKPGVLKRVFFLAFEEMDQVRERNNKVILENIGKIKFCYGIKDKWAPESLCLKLQSDIPNVNAKLCNYDHVFVFKYSSEMGYEVSDWIKGTP